jgi:formylglycine-generating enzyme required for sulfatase activity
MDNLRWLARWVGIGLVLMVGLRAASPAPASIALGRKGELTISNTLPGGTVTVEKRSSLTGARWQLETNFLTKATTATLAVALADKAAYYRVSVKEPAPIPSDMKLVPEGVFTMGDSLNISYLPNNERPAHQVYVSRFHIAQFEVTNEQMRQVLQWAFDLGKVKFAKGVVTMFVQNTEGNPQPLLYLKGPTETTRESQLDFVDGRFVIDAGKEQYGCVFVTWFGAAAYCNYRSLIEGLTPCFNLADWSCDTSRNGYRLPTEAEWEKASRGGLVGNHYPWPSAGGGPFSHIDASKANYTVVEPHYFHNSPVGYYNGSQTPPGVDMANGFGIYDMAGNVREWCLDWFDPLWYATAEASLPDTTGPASGTRRVVRGASFDQPAVMLRCGARDTLQPDQARWYNGCRVVRRF